MDAGDRAYLLQLESDGTQKQKDDTRANLHTNGKGLWFMLKKLGKEALGDAVSTDLPDGYRLVQFFWVLEVFRSPVAKDVYFIRKTDSTLEGKPDETASWSMLAGVLKDVATSFQDEVRYQLKSHPGEIKQYVPPAPKPKPDPKPPVQRPSRVNKTPRKRAASTSSLISNIHSLRQSIGTSLSRDTSQATTPGSIHADVQSHGSLAGHSANASNSIAGPSESEDDKHVLSFNPVLSSAEVVDPLGLPDADSNVDPFDINEFLDFTGK